MGRQLIAKLLAGVVAAVLTVGAGTAAAIWIGPGRADSPGLAEASARTATEIRAARGEVQVQAQVSPDDDEPYLGLLVRPLDDEEALDLGIPGGVSVDRVLEDGPAAGVFEPGDVVTFIDGTQIGGMADLRQWLDSAAVGQVVSVTVIRGDDTHDLALTLGSRPVDAAKAARSRIQKRVLAGPSGQLNLSGLLPIVLGQLKALEEKFVRGEVVFETDDGFKTYTVVRGVLSAIDVANGTFTVTPRDGSGAVGYKISDGTVVATLQKGSLQGLNDGDMALVVAVDGDVKLVHSGELMQLGDLFELVQKHLKELEESRAVSK